MRLKQTSCEEFLPRRFVHHSYRHENAPPNDWNNWKSVAFNRLGSNQNSSVLLNSPFRPGVRRLTRSPTHAVCPYLRVFASVNRPRSPSTITDLTFNRNRKRCLKLPQKYWETRQLFRNTHGAHVCRRPVASRSKHSEWHKITRFATLNVAGDRISVSMDGGSHGANYTNKVDGKLFIWAS